MDDADSRQTPATSHHRTLIDLYHEISSLRDTQLWETCMSHGLVYSIHTVFGNKSNLLKNNKKRHGTLRNLFSMGNRFVKPPMKRGIYLASILYNSDRILVTTDDNLPTVLVDASEQPLNNGELDSLCEESSVDLNWLLKLSCTWDDGVHWLSSCNSAIDPALMDTSGSLYTRSQLLYAAKTMRAECGTNQLGRLHTKPIVDAQGAVLLVTINYVEDVKSVQGVAVRWTSLSKLLKKRPTSNSDDGQPSSLTPAAPLTPSVQCSLDMLTASLVDILNFHESTYIPLDRGLYLCYVKLHSSMNDISVVVPENLPSVLPFVFVRDNPHVSR